MLLELSLFLPLKLSKVVLRQVNIIILGQSLTLKLIHFCKFELFHLFLCSWIYYLAIRVGREKLIRSTLSNLQGFFLRVLSRLRIILSVWFELIKVKIKISSKAFLKLWCPNDIFGAILAGFESLADLF